MFWWALSVQILFCSRTSTALVYTENFQNYEFMQNEPFRNGIRLKHIWKSDLLTLDPDGLLRSTFIEAIKIWSETVSVRNRSSSRFLLPMPCDVGGVGFRNGRTCCLKNCVPTEYCGELRIVRELFNECRICTDVGVNVTIPRGVGLSDTDLLVIMKTGEQSICETSDAYASVCVADEQTDRPILAQISVCSKTIYYPNRRQKEILLHEIAHTLGLTSSSYAFLRHRDGTPRTPRNKLTDVPNLGQNDKGVFITATTTGLEKKIVLQTASRSVEKTVFHFTLPTVLEVARRIFNAPNLTAFPMEDLSIEGLERSHFDGRTALGELMTAPIGIPTKITHFLLAFMYDTGWYDVSGAHATVPTWGLLAGEEFVTKSCYDFVKLQQQRNNPPSPFCGWPEYNIPACLPDRSGYGLCDISPIKALAYHAHNVDRPKMNQLLKQYNFGGRYLQINNCPIITDRRKEELWYRFGHVCTQEINIDSGAPQNFAMEEFGSNSICLDHDRQDPWRIQTEIGFSDLKMLGASCHRHRCVRGSGLEVIIGNSTYTCPLEGGSIKINVEAPSGRLLGSVHCPICETLCPRENCQVPNPKEKKAAKMTSVQKENQLLGTL